MKTHYTLTLMAMAACMVMNSQTSTIRKDLMSYKKQPVQQTTTNNPTTNNLQQQAAHLDSIAKKIQVASVTRLGVEKTVMLEEAADIKKDATVEKIQVLELAIKTKATSYIMNNKTLGALLNQNIKDVDVLDRAESYKLAASQFWKTAMQMLLEAYNEKENEAKLGIMSNAEEEQFMALAQQNKAIGLLTKYTSKFTTLPVNYICVR